MDLTLRNNLKTAKDAFSNAARGIRDIRIALPELPSELKQSLRSLESLYEAFPVIIDGITIEALLADLKTPSENIKNATKEMQSAIDTLEKIDDVTKKLAKTIKLLGTLASKIAAKDIPGIGEALGPLLALAGTN